MPVLFDEKSSLDSSGEKKPPWMAVVSRNCSIVYCFAGRCVAVGFGGGGILGAGAWADTTKVKSVTMGAIHFISSS